MGAFCLNFRTKQFPSKGGGAQTRDTDLTGSSLWTTGGAGIYLGRVDATVLFE